MKSNGTRWALILIASHLVVACGDKVQEAPKQAIQIATFEGMHVPGTAATAKLEGFTQCTNEYSHFKCIKSGAVSVLGVAAESAYVNLNSADAFSPNYYSSSGDVTLANPESLSYRDVHLKFEGAVYDQNCVKKKKSPKSWLEPEECRIHGGIESLRTALVANGWIEEFGTKYHNYYKPGTPIRVSVRGADVDIEPLSPSEASESWKRVLEKSAAQTTSDTKSQDFINSMK